MNLRGFDTYENITVANETHLSHDGVGDGVQVDVTLIRKVVEDISCPHSLRTALLVAKDEVDPLMKLT